MPTPPITDHDSGHSTEGGAAAEVLRLFSEAEAENGVSRILVGFHFRHAEGIKHGRHIGRRAVTQILKPEH